jgi:putative addiction module component (TIGR02574 family)
MNATNRFVTWAWGSGPGSGGITASTAWIKVMMCSDCDALAAGYDSGMAKTADDLRDEALALSTHDRARLASDLLASLDSDTVNAAEIDRVWSIETQRRAAMLESGDAGTVSWDEVEQRFAERRTQRRT